MSVLAVDIGNSRIGFGVFSNGKSKDPALRLQHAQLDSDLDSTLQTLWKTAEGETRVEEDDQTAVVITSVVPALTQRLVEAVTRNLSEKALVVGKDITVPLKTKLRDETTVGTDRLLAAMAAYVNVEKACVIVQVGSALVVDCIDDEGIFRGGAIAPGLQMGAKALHDFAAQLPNVSLTPPDEAEPFGRYTQEAMNLGLYAAARGCVRELIERYATALGNWPHVVATGGDANALLGSMELIDSFVPDLVLQGAALAWEHHRMTK